MSRFRKPVESPKRYAVKEFRRTKVALWMNFRKIDDAKLIFENECCFRIEIKWHELFDDIQWLSVWSFDCYGIYHAEVVVNGRWRYRND